MELSKQYRYSDNDLDNRLFNELIKVNPQEEKIASLLNEGASIDAIDYSGDNLLLFFLIKIYEIAQFNNYKKDADGNYEFNLQVVTSESVNRIVKLLLDRGVSPNYKRINHRFEPYRDCLYVAMQICDLKVLDLLLLKGGLVSKDILENIRYIIENRFDLNNEHDKAVAINVLKLFSKYGFDTETINDIIKEYEKEGFCISKKQNKTEEKNELKKFNVKNLGLCLQELYEAFSMNSVLKGFIEGTDYVVPKYVTKKNYRLTPETLFITGLEDIKKCSKKILDLFNNANKDKQQEVLKKIKLDPDKVYKVINDIYDEYETITNGWISNLRYNKTFRTDDYLYLEQWMDSASDKVSDLLKSFSKKFRRLI